MDDEIEYGLVSALELGFAEDTGAIEVLYIIIKKWVNLYSSANSVPMIMKLGK